MKACVPALLKKISTFSKGLRLIIDTNEIDDETYSEIGKLREKFGYFFFAESEIKEIDLKSLPPIILERGEKTPSERLRAVLFVYYKQNKLKEDFDTFYKKTIERYIESVKEKLT